MPDQQPEITCDNCPARFLCVRRGQTTEIMQNGVVLEDHETPSTCLTETLFLVFPSCALAAIRKIIHG